MSYDPKFTAAAAQRQRDAMEAANYAAQNTLVGSSRVGGRASGKIESDPVRGVTVEFLANGFLVAPRMDYIGANHELTSIARDRDELLKLVGEMIDAHWKR
jgi:hypothetical protein